MNIPTAVIQLAELYNATSITGQSEHDGWPKQFRNEVRHTLRQHGYVIEMISYQFGTTTSAVLRGED